MGYKADIQPVYSSEKMVNKLRRLDERIVFAYGFIAGFALPTAVYVWHVWTVVGRF